MGHHRAGLWAGNHRRLHYITSPAAHTSQRITPTSQPPSSLRRLPLGVWLGTGLLWGTTWVVIRIGLRYAPPFTLAAVRTAVAAVTLLLLAAWWDSDRRPVGGELRFWIVVGAMQIGVPYALIFWAEQYIASGLTAMLFATFPAFTAVAAHFMLKDEPLTRGKAAGTLLAIVAVGLLAGPTSGAGARPPIPAVVAILIASLAAALGTVIVRRHGQGTSTIWLTAIQVAAAAVFLGVLALALERGRPVHVNLTSVIIVLYLAWVISVGCYLGLFWLLKRLDATFVSMGVIFETGVGVFLGAWALGESLGGQVFAGLALVALSVYLVTMTRKETPTVVP